MRRYEREDDRRIDRSRSTGTTAYNQWTQFETFPQFMDGVERVEQRTTSDCIGSPRSPARSASGMPRSQSSIPTTGSLGRRSTRMGRTGRHLPQARRLAHQIMVQMDYEPEGMKGRSAARSASTATGSRAISSPSRSSSSHAAARPAPGAERSRRTRQFALVRGLARRRAAVRPRYLSSFSEQGLELLCADFVRRGMTCE